jgi:hypothetical protein
MAGDSHHYARHVEDGRNYVISGGGGAFLHPTHNLTDRLGVPSDLPPPGRQREPGRRYERNFRSARDPKTGKESLFPDRATSRSLVWRNFGFAFMNWQFTLTLLAIFLAFNWLMVANGRIAGAPLANALSGPGAFVAYGRIAFASPWPSPLKQARPASSRSRCGPPCGWSQAAWRRGRNAGEARCSHPRGRARACPRPGADHKAHEAGARVGRLALDYPEDGVERRVAEEVAGGA